MKLQTAVTLLCLSLVPRGVFRVKWCLTSLNPEDWRQTINMGHYYPTAFSLAFTVNSVEGVADIIMLSYHLLHSLRNTQEKNSGKWVSPTHPVLGIERFTDHRRITQEKRWRRRGPCAITWLACGPETGNMKKRKHCLCDLYWKRGL